MDKRVVAQADRPPVHRKWKVNWAGLPCRFVGREQFVRSHTFSLLCMRWCGE